MKDVIGLAAVFFTINGILWIGTTLIDTFQWISGALIITGIIGLIIAWARYAFRNDK